MSNPEDFIHRIEQLLHHFSLSTSAFADKIGVQRSGISHLLSGRNKPSLDFVLKVIQAYPEINLYWLMNGSGGMLLEEKTSIENPSAPTRNELKSAKNSADRIVVLHSDGTFSEYKPRN
ncbi:MAG: XRE family transcriptional regulator [Flavobacterium sp.]|nr:MAG: XRE family transcriptional regulator [Flavobacterium sp.]